MRIQFVFCLLVSFSVAQAQITITTADLPHAGNVEVLSTANTFTGLNLTLTGPNYNWDYSALVPTGQRIDSFFPESAGNPLLTFYFINSGLNPNRSNVATPGVNFTLGTLVTLSKVYNYYYNATAGFSQSGIGAEVNGIPLPITFSPHDKVYALPMIYNQRDSVTFSYGIDLTSTLGIYYTVRKTRKNTVDGWGSLITPFSTYNSLRVKTQLIEVDSVYFDSLGFGFATPPITTYEYKWMATGQNVPALQINTSGTGIVTSIAYKDALVGILPTSSESFSSTVYPNPASDRMNVSLSNAHAGQYRVDLISLTGALVISKWFTVSSAEQILTLELNGISTGHYLLKLTDSKNEMLRLTPVDIR